MRKRTLTEPARQTPIFGDYEVVVLGGGPAAAHLAIEAGTTPRKVNVGALQRWLEKDGAFLGPVMATAAE